MIFSNPWGGVCFKLNFLPIIFKKPPFYWGEERQRDIINLKSLPQLTKITLGWWEGANEGFLKFEGENIIKKKKILGMKIEHYEVFKLCL